MIPLTLANPNPGVDPSSMSAYLLSVIFGTPAIADLSTSHPLITTLEPCIIKIPECDISRGRSPLEIRFSTRT